MPNVNGILETALYVKDVRSAAAFYQRVFGFAVLLESDRLIALDVAGKSVLLLFKEGETAGEFSTPGGVIPGHNGSGVTHFAFAIAASELPAWREHLASFGVPIESTVNWQGGAMSVYLRDLDQNLVELITPGFWRTY